MHLSLVSNAQTVSTDEILACLLILLPCPCVPVAHRLTYMRLQTYGTVCVPVLEAVESVSKLLHLVLVPCYVGTYIPLPVFVDDRSSVNAELNTLVGQVAHVHQHRCTTH